MIVARCQINYAMIQRGAFLSLFKRINVRTVEVVFPRRSKERLETVCDAFNLLQMCFTSHWSVVKNATITRRHNAVGGNRSAVLADRTREEFRQASVMSVKRNRNKKFAMRNLLHQLNVSKAFQGSAPAPQQKNGEKAESKRSSKKRRSQDQITYVITPVLDLKREREMRRWNGCDPSTFFYKPLTNLTRVRKSVSTYFRSEITASSMLTPKVDE